MSTANMASQRHSFQVRPPSVHAPGSYNSPQALNTTFVVDANYLYTKELGTGAYGAVVGAKHRVTGHGIAIKRISSISSKVRPPLLMPRSRSLIPPRKSSRNAVSESSSQPAISTRVALLIANSSPRLLHHFRGHKNITSLIDLVRRNRRCSFQPSTHNAGTGYRLERSWRLR